MGSLVVRPSDLLGSIPRHEALSKVVVLWRARLAHRVQRDMVVGYDEPVTRDEAAGAACQVQNGV